MNRNLKWTAFLIGLFALLMVGVALAEPTAATTAPAASITPANPLPTEPTDLIPVIKAVIEAFGTAWYLGLALVLYVLVNFMRGKLKIGSWVIRIPVVSDWLDGVGKTWKAVLIIGVTGIAGAFAGMALAPTPWTASGLATVMVSGLISGVLLALAAGGVDSLVSTTKKPDVILAKVAEKTATTGELPKLDAKTLAEIQRWADETKKKLETK